VLKDVELDVRPGDFVGIYGARRAGKSTLLKIAAGFERPDGGQVCFGGRDLRDLSRQELAHLHRDQVVWVEHGGPHIPEMAVSDYVAMPLLGRTSTLGGRRRVAAALSWAGVSDMADFRWRDVSDTARMLVALAHALVREPRLVVVDDPTVGMGIIDRERVVGLLRTAAEEGGVGVLMAVPDMPAMLHASQVRALNRGRLVAPAEEPSDGANVVDFPHHRRA
jgi:ABC-type lipoprotein export system ATPase subunit